MLLESAVMLALARLIVTLLPFRMYARRLGRAMTESSRTTTAPETVQRITHGIGYMSERLPWRTVCLEQALAAKIMLRRRRLSNTLYLAVAREVSLEAHAWIRSGSVCVTGEADFSRYTIVAKFADEGRA